MSITYWWEKTLAIAVLSVWCNGLGQGWADARTKDLATFQLACDMHEIINLSIVLFLNRVSWSEKSVNTCSEIVQETGQCVRSGVHGKMGGMSYNALKELHLSCPISSRTHPLAHWLSIDYSEKQSYWFSKRPVDPLQKYFNDMSMCTEETARRIKNASFHLTTYTSAMPVI